MSGAGLDGPAQTAYAPPAGKGPIVVLLSGQDLAELVHAADMPEQVTAVVAYYPATSFVSDALLMAERFQVPVLILAGQRDTYHNCCLIESMRAIERGARERGKTFELVVYPYAEHGFNLQGSGYYRGDDEADAWKRSVEMLRRYQPLR